LIQQLAARDVANFSYHVNRNVVRNEMYIRCKIKWIRRSFLRSHKQL